LLKNIIKLLVSLSLINNVYADTTNNLVSQDFTTGWSGTNISTTHGSNIIAGVDGEYVVSDSVSLNDAGINKESLNEGFSVTGSADIWFWNNYSQSVTQTIKTIDDNGQTITQNRTVSGTCATWNGCGYGSMTDTLIVNSNTQQDYDVSLRYSFSVPNQPNGHYGADLKNPSLTVNYTYVPPLDSATQTALFDLNEDIKDDLSVLDLYDAEILTKEFKQDIGVNYVNEITGEVYESEPPTDLVESFDMVTESEGEETSLVMEDQEDSQDLQELQTSEQESSLQAEQKLNEEADTEKETLTEEEQKTEVASDNKSNVSSENKSFSLNKTMAKIDDKIKEIDKNLQMKNFVKIKAMMSQNILLNYNVPFYKDKAIYENQPNITDTRILYANSSLVSYTQNDPIFQKETQIQKIRQQKEKLLREIEVLKNG